MGSIFRNCAQNLIIISRNKAVHTAHCAQYFIICYSPEPIVFKGCNCIRQQPWSRTLGQILSLVLNKGSSVVFKEWASENLLCVGGWMVICCSVLGHLVKCAVLSVGPAAWGNLWRKCLSPSHTTYLLRLQPAGGNALNLNRCNKATDRFKKRDRGL